MSPRHCDSLLGGAWKSDLDDEEVFVRDTSDEIQDLLDELIEVLVDEV